MNCKSCGKKISLFQRVIKRSVDLCPKCKEQAELMRLKGERIYTKTLSDMIGDGRVNEEQKQQLEKIKSEYGLSDVEINRASANVFLNIYNKVISDRVVTDEEFTMIKKLQVQLGIPDQEVPRQLTTLARLNLLTKIQAGDLPVISPRILLQKNEITQYECPCSLFEERVISRRYEGGYRGVSFRIVKGVYYRTGGFKGHPVVETGMVKVDNGTLFVTSKRIVFNGIQKTFSIPYKKLINLSIFQDGIQLNKEGKAKAQALKIEDPELVATLISVAAQSSL
jgi:hypothetical protein